MDIYQQDNLSLPIKMTRGQWIALITIVLIIIIIAVVAIVFWNRNKRTLIVDVNRPPVINANVAPTTAGATSKPIRIAPLKQATPKVQPTFSVIRGRPA